MHKDAIATPKGHWVFKVFDGDVERKPLTVEQERENAVFASRFPEAVCPLHVGQIVSQPIDQYEGDNVIATTGKALYLDRLFALSGPPAALSHIGVGNDATAAAAGDTQLGGSTPSPDLRAFDSTPIRSSLTVTAVRTYATGEGNMTWQEIALFNGSTNGSDIMFNRIAPIGPFTKTSAVAIEATVTITQS